MSKFQHWIGNVIDKSDEEKPTNYRYDKKITNKMYFFFFGNNLVTIIIIYYSCCVLKRCRRCEIIVCTV